MKKKSFYRAERTNKAWLYLLPALFFILVFNVYPLIRTFYMSVHNNNIMNPTYVGFQNFPIVLNDKLFRLAMKNTLIYSVTVVPLSIIISMFIALILNEKIKGDKFFETIFFIPYLTSVIAVGIVFRYLFNGKYGFINHMLSFVGVGPIDFLNNPDYNMLAAIIFGVWNALAFNIIVILAGLRGIDESYYKIADTFGASSWEQFKKITLPQLTSIITFLFLTSFIATFKVYNQIFALFNGKAGVGNRLMTAVFYIYRKFYVEYRYGQAMAAAVLLFLFLLVLTFAQRKIIKIISR
ncbi:sugar ABC transporter permease [uncultured Anaerococcus sp.]|uniref:carbohydrate ABC transporter permease n=1 Tax=uncultured Anaerococcus sp. TaxID=293428 RepID=UPI00288AC715|nr:sugar ABC transporter permease [uncultured Anaerococcus sp.]